MHTTDTTLDQNLLITPKQLAKWIEKNEKITILDIRPRKERNEWSIPESRHVNLYDRIKSGDPDPFRDVEVPDDRPVITVCGAGKTSLTAARKLHEQGIEAYSLDGGMKAWNFIWNTAETTLADDTKVIQVRRPAKGCLSYLVGSGDEAVVIDASLDPGIYRTLAESHGWNIRYVMDTHLHADYVSRSRELANAVGADFLLHHETETDFPFMPVSDQQKINFGKTRLTVLHTPGHTPESVSCWIDSHAVFTGDTLFTDGVGRPDLKADRQAAVRKANNLYDSLQRLMSLDNNTRVFSAHLARSIPFDEPIVTETIGGLTAESNLLSLPREEFIEKTISRIPPTPANYKTISSINRKGSLGEHRLEDLEAGGNRCAVS